MCFVLLLTSGSMIALIIEDIFGGAWSAGWTLVRGTAPAGPVRTWPRP